jgi:hypothetical protein
MKVRKAPCSAPHTHAPPFSCGTSRLFLSSFLLGLSLSPYFVSVDACSHEQLRVRCRRNLCWSRRRQRSTKSTLWPSSGIRQCWLRICTARWRHSKAQSPWGADVARLSVKIFLQPSHSRCRVICGRPAQQHSIVHPPPPPPPQTLTNTAGAGVALSSGLRDLPAVAHQQHDTPTLGTRRAAYICIHSTVLSALGPF